MNDDAALAELLQDWDALEQRHGTFARKVDAAVTEWTAAPRSADWEGPYALWPQRNGARAFTEPLDVDMADVDWRRAVLYGRDEDGAVVVARRFTVIGGERRVDSEVLWVTLAGRSVQLLFLHRHGPSGAASVVLRRVAAPLHQGRRLAGVRTWFDGRSGDGSESIETYNYDGDVLTRIVHEHRGAELRREELTVTCDADGTVARIDARVGGDRDRIVYVKTDAEAVRAAVEAVEALLPAAIVAWAIRVAPADETPRSLLIGYVRAPNDVLPPALAMGVEGDQAAALLDHTEQRVTDPVPKELSAIALRTPFATLNQLWSEDVEGRHDDGPRQLLVAVASRLAELRWDELLPHAHQDFVVAAVALG